MMTRQQLRKRKQCDQAALWVSAAALVILITIGYLTQ